MLGTPAVIFAIRLKGFKKSNVILRNIGRNLIAVAAAAKPHKICDSVNENRRLSASSASQQQKRTFRRHHRLTLHFIELRKLALDIAAPGS